MSATTTPAQENKPCPFCRAHLTDRNTNGFYYHPENECWLAGFEFDDDGSVQKWNVRPAPEVSQGGPKVLRTAPEVRAAADRVRNFLGAWGFNGIGMTVRSVQESHDTQASLTVEDINTILCAAALTLPDEGEVSDGS
ncbi:hypothetical protein [Burkholderia plantarii]|uniref:hypothetical protein n=1 Tax=Burkholderia plantarii TaxID=41899 RepID=UPI00114D158F|nr:hypothetical protein [Burkholderia plantarii]